MHVQMREPVDISERLEEAIADRLAKGLPYSNRELGKFLKRRAGEGSDVYVGKLRSGAATNPRIRVLVVLGEYFGRDPLWFVSSDNDVDARVPGVLFRVQHLDPRDQGRILDTVENMIAMLDERDAGPRPERREPQSPATPKDSH